MSRCRQRVHEGILRRRHAARDVHDPRGAQFLYVSHAGDEDGMEDAAIYKVRLDGAAVGRFGTAGKRPKQFGLANSVDCRTDNELLVGEMTNWRVQRVTLRGAR